MFAITGSKKQSEAALLAVRVDGLVSRYVTAFSLHMHS